MELEFCSPIGTIRRFGDSRPPNPTDGGTALPTSLSKSERRSGNRPVLCGRPNQQILHAGRHDRCSRLGSYHQRSYCADRYRYVIQRRRAQQLHDCHSIRFRTAGLPSLRWQTVTVSVREPYGLLPDISVLGISEFPRIRLLHSSIRAVNNNGHNSSCALGISDAVDDKRIDHRWYFRVCTCVRRCGGVDQPISRRFIREGLGNVNPMLYQLAVSNPTAFHQVTTGDNNISCQVGSPPVRIQRCNARHWV